MVVKYLARHRKSTVAVAVAAKRVWERRAGTIRRKFAKEQKTADTGVSESIFLAATLPR